MDVPHSVTVYNHSEHHHAFSMPQSLNTQRMPGDNEIVPVTMHEEIVAEPMVSSYGGHPHSHNTPPHVPHPHSTPPHVPHPHNTPTQVPMPWMEEQMCQKAPQDARDMKEDIKVNITNQSWPDTKPSHSRKKERGQCQMENSDELTEEVIVSNFVPLTWAKSPKPHTSSSLEKDNNNDSEALDSKEEAAIAITALMTSQPSGFTCVQCGHVVHRSQLLRHVRMHTADRPFKCEVCKRAFRQKSNLIVHMRMHTGELPFKCDLCDKAFRQKSILVTHIRTHTKVTPYKCNMCPKAFTQKSNLVEHVRVHTGEKPYICPECNKAFAQKSNLVVHIRSHTGEAPFKCSHCSKAFRQKSILTTHMRTHTGELPFKCQECDRAFAQKSNLVEHSRQHTGEKPYVCRDCDKAFIRHQDLLQHTRHHTGRKPYDCPECGKMFVRKKHMEKHYQSHIKHRFNCKVCGLGFMDENLMVIHLTTHCHCHICDRRFATKDDLTEHCRIHALGVPGEGEAGAMPNKPPLGHDAPPRMPSLDRVNEDADSTKLPKPQQHINPATFSVGHLQRNEVEGPVAEYSMASSNDQMSSIITISSGPPPPKPLKTIRVDPASFPAFQTNERESDVTGYMVHTSR